MPEKVVNKPTVKPHVHYAREVFVMPTGIVLGIAERVSRETGYSVGVISKIMWSESRYDIKAKGENWRTKIVADINGATSTVHYIKSMDYGLFQINDQHIPEAKSLGIDVFTLNGNADFAIVLMKRNGLVDWGYSKSVWDSV